MPFGRGRLRLPSKGGISFPARFRFTHHAGQGYRHYIEATMFGYPVMKINEYYLDGNARMELPVGVIENENDASASMTDLVSALNTSMGAGTYDFIDTEGREDVFFGGGIQFLDEDLKYLLSPAASAVR